MAPLAKIAALLSLALLVSAQGTQFITGDCTTDADCASNCCGFNSGKCAAPFPANERLEGCGRGDNAPNGGGASNAALVEGGNGAAAPAPAAPAPTAAAPAAPAAGNTNPAGAGLGNGAQFITGVCASDADCASGCCGFRSGKCAGPVIAQTRDGGCGFGDNVPNDDAAQPFLNGNQARSADPEPQDNTNPAGAGLRVKRGEAYWL